MSDTSQGPGWWQASDYKWYPPETAPGQHESGGGDRLGNRAGRARDKAEQAQADKEATVQAKGAIVQLKSHEDGRNSDVTLYRDRIERVRQKKIGSLSRAKQDAEVIPMRAVSSVQAKKDGFAFTKVTVFASQNTIEFRLRHDDAQRFKAAITDLIVAQSPEVPAAPPTPAGTPPAASSVGDELKKLAELRDAGVLTQDEFAAQKAKLLG